MFPWCDASEYIRRKLCMQKPHRRIMTRLGRWEWIIWKNTHRREERCFHITTSSWYNAFNNALFRKPLWVTDEEEAYLWTQGVVESEGRDVTLHFPAKELKVTVWETTWRDKDESAVCYNRVVSLLSTSYPSLTPAAVLQLGTLALSFSCTQ